jgi:hypothetical protein
LNTKASKPKSPVAKLVLHCCLALGLAAGLLFAILYVLASWASGDPFPFDNGGQIPWESLGRLAIPFTAVLAGIVGAVIAGHGQATRLEELKNDRDANVTDRYTKAIEQLGSAHPAIRTGGIYALERIGHDSERDRTMINNVLYSSLFRDSRTVGEESGTSRDMTKWEESATIVAIIRLRREGEADRLASYLMGNTILENADLRCAYLHRSNLSRLVLINADLSGADLSHAHVENVILSFSNLSGATLKNANLRGAQLLDANMQQADLTEADLRGADIEGVNFSGATLKDAEVDEGSATSERFSKKQLRDMKQVPASVSSAPTVDVPAL